METPSTDKEHDCPATGTAMVAPMVAQAGLGPNMILAIAIAALVVFAFLFYLLRRGRRDAIDEEERPELEEGEKPTEDLLEERDEVEEPVEDYDDMSLAEVKKAKMAKVKGESRKGRATAGEATEEARQEHDGAEPEADAEESTEAPEREVAEEAPVEEEPEADADRADERKREQPPPPVGESESDDETARDGEPTTEEDEGPAEPIADDEGGGTSIPAPSSDDAKAKDEEHDEETLGESSSVSLPTPGEVSEASMDEEADAEEESAETEEAPEDEADAEDEESADEKPGGTTAEEVAPPEDERTADEDVEEATDEKPEPEETEQEEDDEDHGDGSGEPSGGSDGGAADGEPSDEPVDDDETHAGEASTDEEPVDAQTTEDAADDDAADEEFDPEAEPKSLERGLKKTREGLFDQLNSFFTGEKLSPEMVEEVEEVLFQADIGPRVAQDILDAIEEQLTGEELEDPGKVWGFIRHYTEELLQAHEEKLDPTSDRPFVVLVVGVNGVGKTTTIGKMASRFKKDGLESLLVAGDTFRAGAVDQLGIWAERTGLRMHKGDEGADPASVIYGGIERAIEEDIDVVLCDTSGRLHTDVNLMDELEKMERVAGNAKEGAPQEVHLVLDANTGQNAIQQAEKFSESLDVSGITLTKFDGTARGGVILGVCKRFDAPVRYVGIGERVVDLREFHAEEFVEALFM